MYLPLPDAHPQVMLGYSSNRAGVKKNQGLRAGKYHQAALQMRRCDQVRTAPGSALAHLPPGSALPPPLPIPSPQKVGRCLRRWLRPSERPIDRVRCEHNSKCMKAKGEGPHDSPRETRKRHALAADAGRTCRRAAGALPPRHTSAYRVLVPLCGAIK
jgi:hypothetical protein